MHTTVPRASGYGHCLYSLLFRCAERWPRSTPISHPLIGIHLGPLRGRRARHDVTRARPPVVIAVPFLENSSNAPKRTFVLHRRTICCWPWVS
jgi:hypothetical protein